MRLSILLLVSLMGASAAYAEVFRYTDKNGNLVYTDEPPAGAEKIEVREVPTISMPKGPLTEENLQRAARDADTESDQGSSAYRQIEFIEPQNDAAFWSGSGNITLSVAATPALRDGHLFEVLLDGEPIGQSPSGSFQVQHIDRGTHTATVRVVDRNGVAQTGESITFTVHRPSVNN